MSADAALLVIDVQESFRRRPYFDERDLPAFIARQQALVDCAQSLGAPVVQILHVEDEGPFSEASGLVVPLAPLRIAPDAVFRKRRHSALVGTGLDVWLTQRGIRRVIVSGIRTEQCCETTARHASDLGYEVDYCAEATLTFPMKDASGRLWSASELRERTELVLAGRFARIVSVDDVVASLSRRQAA